MPPKKNEQQVKATQALQDAIENGEKIIFALDIGTRSVVGILGLQEKEGFRILDHCQKFHLHRAMRDGQIENIDLVSQVVSDVKSTLENRHGIVLDKVSIAAAGRALKTKKITYTHKIDPNEEITQKHIQAIEYAAVGMAQSAFFAESNQDLRLSFYCVGYSIIYYHLDNYPLSNLVGHRGNEIAIHLIAAFLPQNVVQSLYAVMDQNQLAVDSLTLEPIAAINVIVPQDVRLLNIALVDIGAGTSDIAISKNGSIIAYDMVTVAGDEITEFMMKHYLVDFQTAEKLKLALSNGTEKVEFLDILGLKKTETKTKFLKAIKPVVESLGKAIGGRILEINEDVPLAVFLVGGGSQIPGICQSVAKAIRLPQNRISIGGKQPFRDIFLPDDTLQSPEFITPIGIGTVSSLYQGCDFFSVTINDKKMMLFNYGGTKVIDALLLAAIKPQNLIGISPRPLVYFLDGEKYTKRGTPSIPGELTRNGQPVSIDAPLYQGDVITIKPAIHGSQPVVTAGELQANAPCLSLTVNGEDILAMASIYCNGQPLADEYQIQSQDQLETHLPGTIEEVFLQLKIETTGLLFFINDKETVATAPICQGDQITTKESPVVATEVPKTKDLVTELESIDPQSEKTAFTDSIKTVESMKSNPISLSEAIEALSHEEETILPEEPEQDIQQQQLGLFSNDLLASPPEDSKETSIKSQESAPIADSDDHITICLNDTWRSIPLGEKKQLLLFDLLNFVDMDFKNPLGTVLLKKNLQDATFTTAVHNGDRIDISWEIA